MASRIQYEWLHRSPRVGDVVLISKEFEGRVLLFIPDFQTRKFYVKLIGKKADGFIGRVVKFVEIYALNGVGIEEGTRLDVKPEDILKIYEEEESVKPPKSCNCKCNDAVH